MIFSHECRFPCKGHVWWDQQAPTRIGLCLAANGLAAKNQQLSGIIYLNAIRISISINNYPLPQPFKFCRSTGYEIELQGKYPEGPSKAELKHCWRCYTPVGEHMESAPFVDHFPSETNGNHLAKSSWVCWTFVLASSNKAFSCWGRLKFQGGTPNHPVVMEWPWLSIDWPMATWGSMDQSINQSLNHLIT